MNSLITVVLLLCIIIGIEVMNLITKFIYNGSNVEDNLFLVVPVNKNEKTIEGKLRKLIRQIMWMDEKIQVKILLVNMNADAETLEICQKICEGKNFIELCNCETICSTLSENTK